MAAGSNVALLYAALKSGSRTVASVLDPIHQAHDRSRHMMLLSPIVPDFADVLRRAYGARKEQHLDATYCQYRAEFCRAWSRTPAQPDCGDGLSRPPASGQLPRLFLQW